MCLSQVRSLLFSSYCLFLCIPELYLFFIYCFEHRLGCYFSHFKLNTIVRHFRAFYNLLRSMGFAHCCRQLVVAIGLLLHHLVFSKELSHQQTYHIFKFLYVFFFLQKRNQQSLRIKYNNYSSLWIQFNRYEF